MPTVSSVHIDAALSNVSILYRNDKYVADKVFPIQTVDKRSNYYFTYNKLDRFTQIQPLTASNSDVAEATYGISTGSYAVEDFALRDFVSRDLIENADAPLDPLMDATENLTNLLSLNREIRLAARLFSTSVITNFATIGTTSGYSAAKWDQDNSTPVADMLKALGTIVGVDGPFCALFGYDAFRAFRQHPDVLAAMQFTQGGVAASEQQIADFFGLEEVIVGEAFKNGANAGQTASYSRIWGDSVLLFKRGKGLAVREPALGYCLQFGQRETQRWTDLSKGARGGEWVKVGWSYTDEETAIDAAFLINDTNV